MYKALYRKYRPLTFDDVVSQPHITVTLQNQLVSEKTAHAYIFTGSRGTGKTTCARIFAKAVNCESPTDGNPCLKCGICIDAEMGALSDMIEIDAASNNGVDDVRNLREGAVYTPERCKYKIYIIDEVHMLSKDAWGALLKIMEEPPAHVKFILATTEIHKVIPTILSRCQRFDFRRILPDNITERLLLIAGKEQIALEKEAAELIARTADGGMRDALSLLDQCTAFAETVTIETVSEAAGIAGREYLFDIVEAIAEKDAAKAVVVIDKLYGMSKDMQKLCDELIAQFRNIMMLKAAPDNTGILACMPNEIERLKAVAKGLALGDVLDKLEILQKSNERLARTPLKRVETEMCMIRLCAVKPALQAAPPQAVAPSQFAAPPQAAIPPKPATAYAPPRRPSSLQEDYGYSPPPPSYEPPPMSAAVQPNQPPPKTQESGGSFKPVLQWAEILEYFSQICPSVSGTLNGSTAFENQGFLFICAQNKFFLNLLKKAENAAKLREAVKYITGKAYNIRAKYTGTETENAGLEMRNEGDNEPPNIHPSNPEPQIPPPNLQPSNPEPQTPPPKLQPSPPKSRLQALIDKAAENNIPIEIN
ncbi:MAG: DNA polymerase III subunit gamma/tau [Oscillospiraceae bacterium]|nr:DNA polymerase III subunit gamma/tau [Oscillospiraceae bacterium]